MVYFIQIDDKNVVQGYSSSKMFDNDIEIEDSLLDDEFKGCPFFYIYNVETEKLEYSKELYNEYLEKKNNRKEPKDLLLKEVATTKVALMQQQNINKEILKQSAENKLEAMKQHDINKSLLKEIADIKINSMKGGK